MVKHAQRPENLFVIPLVLGIKFVRIILELLIVFVQMVSVVKITAQTLMSVQVKTTTSVIQTPYVPILKGRMFAVV